MLRGYGYWRRRRGRRSRACWLFAALAALILSAASGRPAVAEPDPYLLSSFALTPMKPGSFYLGAGFVEGIYSMPRINDTRIVRTGLGFEKFSERPTPMYPAPGWSVGYLFREGSYPAWLGESLRIYTSGTFWSSSTANTTHTSMAPGHPFTVTTIDGFVVDDGVSNSTLVRTTLNTEHTRLNLALRLASERRRPVLSGRLSTSLGLFGGFGRDKYFMQSLAVQPSQSDQIKFTEWVTTRRVGFDGALAWTRRLSEQWDFNVSGRAGVYLLWARLRGVSCGALIAGGNQCTYAPSNFFVIREGFTSYGVSDSDQTVGFLTTVTLSLTWRLGFATARFGGFFSFESAVAGVENPTAPPGTVAGTFVGAAHLKFKPAWSTGGFVVVKIPLYSVN